MGDWPDVVGNVVLRAHWLRGWPPCARACWSDTRPYFITMWIQKWRKSIVFFKYLRKPDWDMAQQPTDDGSDILAARERHQSSRNSPTTDNSEGFTLHVPESILNKIHDDIRNDEDRLRGHLVRAIKIGLLSIEGGEFTLSTERIEKVINSTSSPSASASAAP